MAQLCESGMPLAAAFRIAAGPPKKSRLFIAKEIECGRQIEEILAKRPKWLPKADCIFICAAMNTGRLPQTLLSLAERHERMAKNKARVIARLAYPVGVFHIAALIMPITSMI
ncbi:MAG: type II secretion system F family protein, partial [Verrucomicrobiota bacterium]